MEPRWKPSVTVAAIASRECAGRTEYLLVEEETSEGLKLNNPAGHLDPGESPHQAVVRERSRKRPAHSSRSGWSASISPARWRATPAKT